MAIFSSFRYSFRGSVPKNLNWFAEILPNLDERRFKALLRCTQSQFNIILALIEDHPVFHGVNSDKQFTVQFQLSLVLYRLGSNGVGDGGTIDKVTARVFESILCLEDEFIRWPSAEEREKLVIATFDELPHCIGYVDGTPIPLLERKVLDHVSYYSKDKEYAIKLQGICDYTLLLRQITVGYPGSVHDARVYNNCRLSTHPENHFSNNEYIAGDSAYKLRTTVMTPYRRNSNALTPERRTAYNKYFSSYRVRIEHCFGVLKEIFASLYNLPLRIINAESNEYACSWVRVCCILYNILRPHLTEEGLNLNINARNNDEDNDEADNNRRDDPEAESKRMALVQIIEEK